MQDLQSRLSAHNISVEGENSEELGDRLARALDWCSQQPHCKGNLGIPRSNMPQIKGDKVDEFRDWIKAEYGARSQSGSSPVGALAATQREINSEKVERLRQAPKSVLSKPVMVSKDNYILDGHHRWASLLSQDHRLPIKTVKIDLPIRKLLKAAHEFPGSFKADLEGNVVKAADLVVTYLTR